MESSKKVQNAWRKDGEDEMENIYEMAVKCGRGGAMKVLQINQ